MMIFLWKQHCEMTSQNKKDPGVEMKVSEESHRRARAALINRPWIRRVSTRIQRAQTDRSASSSSGSRHSKSASVEVQLNPSATSQPAACHRASQARVTAWNHRRFGSKQRFLWMKNLNHTIRQRVFKQQCVISS